jgi:hypothetical protein
MVRSLYMYLHSSVSFIGRRVPFSWRWILRLRYSVMWSSVVWQISVYLPNLTASHPCIKMWLCSSGDYSTDCVVKETTEEMVCDARECYVNRTVSGILPRLCVGDLGCYEFISHNWWREHQDELATRLEGLETNRGQNKVLKRTDKAASGWRSSDRWHVEHCTVRIHWAGCELGKLILMLLREIWCSHGCNQQHSEMWPCTVW